MDLVLQFIKKYYTNFLNYYYLKIDLRMSKAKILDKRLLIPFIIVLIILFTAIYDGLLTDYKNKLEIFRFSNILSRFSNEKEKTRLIH